MKALRPAAAALLLGLAAPVSAQDAIGIIAGGLDVSDPEMLMRAALANCLAWGTEGAAQAIVEGGWDHEIDAETGLATLWRDEAIVWIDPSDGTCTVSSAVVPMDRAAYVAEDLLLTAWGGTLETGTDEDGCAAFWTDAAPEEVIWLMSDGNDPTCEDTGAGGSTLTYPMDG